MAYNDTEISEYFEPRELFKFTRGTVNWYYASGDEDVTFEAKVYEAEAISRGDIATTQDVNKAGLKIEVAKSNAFIQQYIAASPSDVITLTVYRIHGDEAGSIVSFIGRVVNIDFQESKAVISVQSNQSSLKRPGLRRVFQTTCPHVLYGDMCRVNRTLFKTDAVLSGLSGLTLTSSAFVVSVNATYDPTWFVGGYIDYLVDGATDRRFITAHDNVAGTITVNLPLVGVAIGDTVSAYAGCDHAPETCVGKFSNIENYGGFPFIPEKNPMDGTPIF